MKSIIMMNYICFLTIMVALYIYGGLAGMWGCHATEKHIEVLWSG